MGINKRTLRSNDWKELNPAAKLFYIHLKAKHNGSNGEVRLHYSELRGVKGLSSPSTIAKAIRELKDKGWIGVTEIGGLHRHYNKYKLTGRFDDFHLP